MPFDATNYEPSDAGAERLRILADFLEAVPEDQFDLSHWAGNLEICGTTACACGWATTIPAFKAAGLRLIRADHGSIALAYQSSRNVNAAARFFNLSKKKALYLFHPWHAPRPHTVAAVTGRIREHLALHVAASGPA